MNCIRHKLKFCVRFIDSQNNAYELRATLPIIITSISPNSEIMDLPAYNENGNENLEKNYSERDSLSQDTNISSLSSSSCSSFSESLREIEELNRLPSYR